MRSCLSNSSSYKNKNVNKVYENKNSSISNKKQNNENKTKKNKETLNKKILFNDINMNTNSEKIINNNDIYST